MRTILVIGAGRSSTSLINYLLEKSKTENFKVRLADVSLELARQKLNGHDHGEAVELDIFDDESRITKAISIRALAVN